MFNYTKDQLKAMRDSAPLDLAKAQALAAEFGCSHRSVISKARAIGVEYVKAAPAPRKERRTTKAEYLEGIRASLGVPFRKGDLTRDELALVLENIG